MDVGFLRTVGLGSLSLWSLAVLQRRLVLVAGSGLFRLSAHMGTCLGVVFWLRIWQPAFRLWLRVRFWIYWLASDWTLRSFLPVVGRLWRRLWPGWFRPGW